VLSCSVDEQLLGLLLTFVTGLSSIPALGFTPSPAISFGHPAELQGDFTAPYPVSSTCNNSVRLPVLPTYDEFSGNMLQAMKMATTFTLA